MTLLARSDGEDAFTGVSYLELAELLMKQGAHPDRDLEQLWRRIVFFICVSNGDDHLRNHGFLMEREGWALSPAYDMNPDPDADGLKLNISEVENEQNLNLALEVAVYFRVSIKRAHAIVEKVVAVVKKWRPLAESLDISADEIEHMEPAFRVADKQP